MPEGDTIFRAARTLDRALRGQVVTRFDTELPLLARVDDDAPIAGRTIEQVDAAGKWTRIYFSGDLILLTHMLMSGSWHIYRPGERWQRPAADMRIAIHTADYVAVGFRVPVAEFHTAASLARHKSVRELGPDLLGQEFDAQAAMERLRSRPEREVGVALLAQTLVAGIGNVFKSEVCFAARVNPFRTVGSLSITELGELVSYARKFLTSNIAEGAWDRTMTYTAMRRTTGRANPDERLWVYRRAGEACRACGAEIQTRKGSDARVTFWCPECQKS